MPDKYPDLKSLFGCSVSVCIASTAMSMTGLFEKEAIGVANAVPKRQLEYAAGRSAARQALQELGFPQTPIGKNPDGTPRWPAGAVGSISHCTGFCAAVVAHSNCAVSVGFDVEPRDHLPSEVERLICDPSELARANTSPEPNYVTLLFSAKEAFYKCYYPVTKHFLDFRDVQILLSPSPSGTRGFFRAKIKDVTKPGAAESSAFQGRWLADEKYIYTGVTLL